MENEKFELQRRTVFWTVFLVLKTIFLAIEKTIYRPTVFWVPFETTNLFTISLNRNWNFLTYFYTMFCVYDIFLWLTVKKCAWSKNHSLRLFEKYFLQILPAIVFIFWKRCSVFGYFFELFYLNLICVHYRWLYDIFKLTLIIT